MRALIIQHDHISPPGPVAEALSDRGYAIELHQTVSEADFSRPHRHTSLPSIEGIDLIVTMGAPWSAYDEDAVGAWVPAELDMLREADHSGVPVLGICFGGQLLAAAHGGRVIKADVPEFSWVEIQTELPHLVPTGPWFQWHFDRWELPPLATEIARNSKASQAFIVRRNLAVQFHPEVTPNSLREWYRNGGEDMLSALGFDAAQALRSTIEQDEASRQRAKALVNAFLEEVADAPEGWGLDKSFGS